MSAPAAVREALRVARRRWKLVLGIWLTTLSAAWITTRLQTPVYRAQAVIKLDPRPLMPGGENGDSAYNLKAFMDTEVKSAKSLEVARQAAALMGWVTPDTPDENALRLAGALQAQVSSERIDDSNLIQISVEDANAYRAFLIARAMVEAYIRKGAEEKAKKSRKLKEFVRQGMREAEEAARQTEEALRARRQEDGAGGDGALSRDLAALQARLDEMTKTYTLQHPDVIALKTRIRAAEDRLRKSSEGDAERRRLEREARSNEENLAFLSRMNKELLVIEADSDPPARDISPALQPDRPIRPDLKKNLFVAAVAAVLLSVAALFLTESADASLGTIEDVERFVGLPVVAVVPHIRVDSARLLPFLSRANDIDEMRKRLVIFHPTISSFAEAYHTLRTNLHLPMRPGARPAPVVGFTSATAGEGKTLTAVNFALTAAQSGLKTLLIEADLRRPAAHQLLGMPREPGLVDAVAGSIGWTEAMKGTSDFLFGALNMDHLLNSPGIENFRLLPSGPAPLNPADILGSAQLERMIREARDRFDLLVIDCAPIMLFADALLLGPKTDGLVLVHKAGVSSRHALKRAKDQLLNVKCKVHGVVLNDLRASEMNPQYGYYAYDQGAES